ncbi:Response regulator receiver domain-containing protein [Sphingobacterium wenxiniae]|uniref:Response regulator receiver domain-containing protein n=2 Tax=Sphingobacterium wenxiniae TaxID=683125 RepID=A0A1I6SQY7_9SPHI|nr:Response regulator receiver domain-containing protein [Sphingobacterium wenxiniae]
MPGINGLELAKKLEGKAIIFSTAYKEYAAEAFDLDAVDYIRKPYQLERLEKAMNKARTWLSHNKNATPIYIELNSSLGKSRINPNDIAYIAVAENDRRDKDICFKDGQRLLAKTSLSMNFSKSFQRINFVKLTEEQQLLWIL